MVRLSSCLWNSRWGGSGGYSKKVYTGTLRPEVQPLLFLYAIFDRKGTPFIYLLLKNGTPFTYLVDNFASHSTALNSLSLTAVRQNQNVSSTFFTAIQCIVSPFGPFYRPNISFHILQLVKPLPFFYLKPKNSTPFGWSPPV